MKRHSHGPHSLQWSSGRLLCLFIITLTALVAVVVPAQAQASRSSRLAAHPTSLQSTKEARSARPATVTLKDGNLTIDADDSDLQQILQAVSRESGVVINGDVKSARVYGVYGPRRPEAVLTDLLEGLGYNIIVRSSPQGALREVELTSRTGGPTPAPPPSAQPPTPPAEPELGPGAVAHPAPEQPDDFQLRRQRNLDRLRQMHDAQEKREQDTRQ